MDKIFFVKWWTGLPPSKQIRALMLTLILVAATVIPTLYSDTKTLNKNAIIDLKECEELKSKQRDIDAEKLAKQIVRSDSILASKETEIKEERKTLYERGPTIKTRNRNIENALK